MNPPGPHLIPKLKLLPDLLTLLMELRATGDPQVVFTNGCFDIMHPGHVRYLAAARAHGDVLIVGLNSDRSVHAIKDPRRPILNQDQRAEVLAGLNCVDHIVVFDDPDPLALITAIEPQVLVKGADWAIEEIIGAREVIASGGRVERIPLVAGLSTTHIIDTILNRFGGSDSQG